MILGDIGPAAKWALPELVPATRFPYSVPATYKGQPLQNALGKYGEMGVRGFAAQALGKIGVVMPEVVAALEEAQKSDKPMVREEATKALRTLSSKRSGDNNK